MANLTRPGVFVQNRYYAAVEDICQVAKVESITVTFRPSYATEVRTCKVRTEW